MRKTKILLLVLVAVILTGCDGSVFLRLDMPVIIEPHPSPKYYHEVEGYVSYDYRNHHITITPKPNYRRHYEPLENAKVVVLETGKTVYTDHKGYFYARGVPYGVLNLKVKHNWIGPYDGVYFRYTSS